MIVSLAKNVFFSKQALFFLCTNILPAIKIKLMAEVVSQKLSVT
jgi:hypothetical protein